MAESIRLENPRKLNRNPDNPRLIFHQDELDALQESISQQGILVPLTVYEDKGKYFILDGERRWRCALKLGFSSVPVIVQPKPDQMQNLMMMFAIHHRRNDWDPLPTALKLKDLEDIYTRRNGRTPTEAQLAELASLTRGEVRRLKKLLALPQSYRSLLMEELEKPRSQQVLTVDHVIEATTAAARLRKAGVVDEENEEQLRRAIVNKFVSGVIRNTVAPRRLSRLARAVEREEVPLRDARTAVRQLIKNPTFGIDDAFGGSAEEADFAHASEQLVRRVSSRLDEHFEREYEVSGPLRAALKDLQGRIARLLRR